MCDEDLYTYGLSDGCILNSGIRIVSYLDENGKLAFNVSHIGDMPLTHFVGLIEVAKLHFYDQAKQEWNDD